MKISNYTMKLAGTGLALTAAILVAGCANPMAARNSHTIKITFDQNGCPQAVNNQPYVGINDEVVWQSDPANVEFRLWFVPFQGNIISPAKSRNPKSNAKGRVTKRFSTHAPYGTTVNGQTGVLYEYTIQSFKNDGSQCTPLDPHIRVG